MRTLCKSLSDGAGAKYALASRQDFSKCRDDYGLMNCVECGSCTYVCPAKRNIVQYIKTAKDWVRAAMAKAKESADKKEGVAK